MHDGLIISAAEILKNSKKSNLDVSNQESGADSLESLLGAVAINVDEIGYGNVSILQ